MRTHMHNLNDVINTYDCICTTTEAMQPRHVYAYSRPCSAACVSFGCLSAGLTRLPSITFQDHDFFQHLEMHMRSEFPPLCGRDHLSFRSYYFPVKVSVAVCVDHKMKVGCRWVSLDSRSMYLHVNITPLFWDSLSDGSYCRRLFTWAH